MNILCVLPSLQHPTMRGSLRHHHLLRMLSRDHRVSVVAMSDTAVTDEARQDLSERCERLVVFRVQHALGRLDSLFGPSTSMRRRALHRAQRVAAQKAMGRAFRSLIDENGYDVVLLCGKALLPAVRGCGVPVVADFCDAASAQIRERLRYVRGVERLVQMFRFLERRRRENRLVAEGIPLAFITARDRALATRNGASAAHVVIPNGVDLEYWRRCGWSAARPRCLIFTGVMDFPPNEDAACHLIQDVMPLLRPYLPDVHMIIAGRAPTRRLMSAATGLEDVTVTGFVDDLRPWLERAELFVAPLRFASGLQNKVLEAFAMELPVVTTSAVAEGLVVRDGESPPIALADGPEETARAVRDLVADPDRRALLAARGRSYAERHFDWDRSGAMLGEFCIRGSGRVACSAS